MVFQQRLHYLYEILDRSEQRRFVYFCSECCCILKVSHRLRPVSEVIEALENRCPSCNSRLESSVVCRSTNIAETWSEVALSANSPRRASTREKALFEPASALRGFCFGFPPLDRIVHRLDPAWLAVFTGRYANVAAELLCFRAQLRKEDGGLDSSVVFIDGGNRSDPYLLASYARLYGVHPKKALRRVATSRAFTMYQLANLVTRELPRAIDDYGSKIVIISDMFGTFNEPELNREEAGRVIDAVRRGIREIREERKVLLLVTLGTKTPYDHMVTDSADLLLELGASRSRVTAALVKHPFQKSASSSFKLQELLQPVKPQEGTLQNGKNGTVVQDSRSA
ncbi:MAG: hypothetical protein HYY68_09050 [Thaumarchaeota archaeon]|nr:hypothetical protein [Nitrososphaerota archaeon]